MAFNHTTGAYTLNGRTYTPGGPGARVAFRTLRHYADTTTGLPTGIDRDALLAAVRMFYRLPLDSRAAFPSPAASAPARGDRALPLSAPPSSLRLTPPLLPPRPHGRGPHHRKEPPP
ncbi:hypothetical protein [Streptomyces sp. MNU103]|uniref:hypothetical protein n=1 Tax=Streptomyces sp. MNU103 TaxID=2560024 RepID=UPI001E46C0E6|nr:hypothetical protein [Streptomyces sp. MNU103]